MKKNHWRHHLWRKVIQKIKRFGGLLGILNANRKIHKRTDTDVAFTWEYPEYRFSTGNMSALIKIQDRPRITILLTVLKY